MCAEKERGTSHRSCNFARRRASRSRCPTATSTTVAVRRRRAAAARRRGLHHLPVVARAAGMIAPRSPMRASSRSCASPPLPALAAHAVRGGLHRDEADLRKALALESRTRSRRQGDRTPLLLAQIFSTASTSRYVEQLRRYEEAVCAGADPGARLRTTSAPNEATVRRVLRFWASTRGAPVDVDRATHGQPRSPRLHQLVNAVSVRAWSVIGTLSARCKEDGAPTAASRCAAGVRNRVVYRERPPPDAALMLELAAPLQGRGGSAQRHLDRD